MSEKGRRLLLVLLGSAHSLNHSLFLVLPLFLSDIVREFGTSVEMIGLVAGVSNLIYGAGGIVGGSLSDRFGEVKTIIIGIALSGVSTFIFMFARDMAGLTVGLLLMAAFASLYHPIANSLISKVFQMEIGEAMGIHGTGGNIGVMFAPMIAVALGALWNWRLPFLFFGLLSLMVSIFLLRVSPTTVEKTRPSGKTLRAIKISALWTLFVYNIAVGLYYRGFEFILPTFLVQKKEFSTMLMGLAVSSMLGVGILGQWLGGRASDSFGSKKTLISASVGIVVGLLSLQMIPQSLLSTFVFILLYGFSFYAHQPAFNSLAGLMTPNELRGVIFGVLFFFNFGLGSVSTTIAGLCATRYGLESALYFITSFSFIALLSSFLIPNKTRSLRKQESEN